MSNSGRNVFRAAFGPYYGTPVYNNFLAWAGYEAEAAGIAEGWAAKDRDKTAGSMSDEMIDEIAIIGNEDEVREDMFLKGITVDIRDMGTNV